MKELTNKGEYLKLFNRHVTVRKAALLRGGERQATRYTVVRRCCDVVMVGRRQGGMD